MHAIDRMSACAAMTATAQVGRSVPLWIVPKFSDVDSGAFGCGGGAVGEGGFNLEIELIERHTEDLRLLERRTVVVPLLRDEGPTLACTHTASATCTLPVRCL